MKKWISFLCVVLFLCSAMTMAVSAAAGTLEDPIVCPDVNFNMVKIPAGETYYVSFTDASGAARRQISISSSTDKSSGFIVVYGDTTYTNDENGYTNIVATPDANGTYLFSITNSATAQATFFINFYEVSPYVFSDVLLVEGKNAVSTIETDIPDTPTLYTFQAAELGIFEVSVDADATLSYWKGSTIYISGLEEETTEGKLEVTCASVGQPIMIGLCGVSTANITITKIGDYTPPASIDYQEYVNVHTPIEGFQLPNDTLTEVNITVAQTVVADKDGIYHYGSATGPILYVDMTGVAFADLYECYYPASGGEVADRMRGTYLDTEGNTCGYDFLNAMHQYADALDSEGYYFLTVDIANYLQMYGKDQGWFRTEYSPFEEIKAGAFVEESAWLITSYYGTANAEPETPDTPANPETPDEPTTDVPADPETPDKPTTDIPADPETPDKPTTDVPADPETPDKPTTDVPTDPETPDKPTTDVPADPETPDEPTTDVPADPETPDEPSTDAPVVEPDSPATGDASAFGVMAALLLSATGTLTFRKKRH